MFDFDELETAKPFRAADEEATARGGLSAEEAEGRKVLYGVRAVLAAPAASVAEALADALLRGRPGRVAAAAHAGLFVSPPAYAEEILTEFGPPQKSHVLADEVGRIHCAAFSMGLRPLGPDESIKPEGSGFAIAIRRLFLFSTPELIEFTKTTWKVLPEPTSCVTAEELQEEEVAAAGVAKNATGSGLRRSFLVRVRSVWVRQAVHTARALGWLRGAGEGAAACDDDDLVVYRCTVQACSGSPPRTQVLQELLESPIYHVREGDFKEALAVAPEGTVLMCEKTMKLMCYMLEEEVRAWAAAHEFGLVEVWRGVRRDDVNKVLALARFISTVYNCTPGEGAPAASERAEGVRFNMLYAKKLAARFRRKRYDGVHGGAPGGDQLDGGQFTDGSVSIRGFALLLDRICRRAAPEADIMRRFVDLGSGRGNAVIAAHALFPFRACVGIEILAEHVAYSHNHACKYRDSEDFYMSINQQVDPEELFIQGDFLKDIDWSDASVVFCNCVTWPRRLIREVALLAMRLRPGAVFLLLGFGKFFPAEPEVLNAFDFRSDVCLVSWVNEPQGVWVYQRR